MPDRLSFDDFMSLCRSQPVVPVWREVVADTVTPVGAFLRLVGDSPGFLLESVEESERWGRYSFIGRNALCTLRSADGHVVASGDLVLPVSVTDEFQHGILATLDALLAYFHTTSMKDLPPLYSGLVGYLGYDIVREIEHLPDTPPDDLRLPDSLFWVIGEICAFDHWRQRALLAVTVQVDGLLAEAGLQSRDGADVDGLEDRYRSLYESALSRLDLMAGQLSGPLASDPLTIEDDTTAIPDVTRTMSSSAYAMGVEVAREHIFAGDIFQVVPSQRFDIDLPVDPFDVYRVLRLVNPSPYLYFLRAPECVIAGASPEPLVRLRDGVVVSRPIAGTRKRGATEQEDRLLEADLVEHPKEVAEHIMLVDLARNDVGKVVDYGTEKVDELMTVERYSHVMHLTSQVSGRLSAGKSPVDAIRATFPAGTLTGAPKVRAMQIIDSLEVTKRGAYGGLVGYIDFCGNLDTAIAIRTMVVTGDGVAHVQAGAGVVAGSDPDMEDKECFQKASALLSAIELARRMRFPLSG
ncbi:MAG: chorismate-binding protein [Actinobacteria bacterium]|nr:chorismate-binding protein [Actinomycetota bacterium]MCL5445825.1 chorismate-binding protein [Actinomycetota bacterium]